MFSFFKSKSLEPFWTYQSSGYIWRMLFSNDDYAVIENRIKETKTVNFSAVNLSDGKIIWRNFSLEEPWFVGLEAVHDNFVFLHGYFDPNLPEHQGIYCVNGKTGDLLWYDQNFSFFSYAEGILYVYKDDAAGRKYFSLEPVTGETVSEFGDDNSESETKRSEYPALEGYQDVQFAERMDVLNPQFADIKTLLDKHSAKIDETIGIDYIDRGENIIFGVHHSGLKGNLCYTMLIVESRTAKVKLNELLADDLTGQAGDLFFLKSNRLISVKNRTILQVHSLES